MNKICSALLLTLLCLPATLLAAGSSRAEKEKQHLETLRDQRSALEQKLKESESSRAEVADRLRDTEQAISVVARKLHALGEERAAARQELGERERNLRQLERQVANRQAQLSRLLRYQFQPQQTDALAVLLAGGDPNVAARDRHSLSLLSRAKADFIGNLRKDAVATRHLADDVRERSEKLAELSKREEQERTNLQQRQQERQAVLAKISGQIKAQRREIETLRQNEERLGKLINSLAKKAAARPPARAAAPAPKQDVRDAPVGKAVSAEPVNASGAFARLRGKLTMPVKGSVTGRFGARREDGQSVWKGLFIRAAEGVEVKAVASGVVVFADWLRGYGNLIIVDHDDDFLSVYGNNQSLIVDVGQKIAAGKTVATVGSGQGGGGQADSGLYFELRHRGRAFDPGKWLGAP